MNKADFLSDQHAVQPFVRWMAQHLGDDSVMRHGYISPRLGPLKFSNLADAFAKYEWPFAFEGTDGNYYRGRTFEASAAVLDGLQRRLRHASDDGAFVDAAVDVVRWGGVAPSNGEWLRANKTGLARRFGDVVTAFEQNGDDIKFVPDLRFNAGMTKVYSLLIDGFVIYDSRVAGALAWFVVQWMQGTGQKIVPDALRFPCMLAKAAPGTGRQKIRNPSPGKTGFPLLGVRPYAHAKWNQRASWIIEAALKAADSSTFTANAAGSRKLEAALFMWGYDLTPYLSDRV